MNKQTLADIRFSFDHELIPHHLEGEDMMAFVNQINKNGDEFLANLLNVYVMTMAKEMGIREDDVPVFSADEFTVSSMMAQGDDSMVFLYVTLPENDDENMCTVRYVFACDIAARTVRYFLVERREGVYALCEIKDGESKMHCRGSLDKIEVLSAVSYVLKQAE